MWIGCHQIEIFWQFVRLDGVSVGDEPLPLRLGPAVDDFTRLEPLVLDIGPD
jgi:hypothetical protein